MGLAAKVEKLDAVPEAQRGLYKESQDKSGFVLDVDGAEDVFAAGLKKNRDDVLTEKKKLETKLAEYGELTPAEAKELRDLKTKLATDKAKAEGNFEELKKQLIDKHNGEVDKLTTREKKLLGTIEKELAENKASAAIVKLDGSAALLLPHVMKEIRVIETDTGFEAIVVGKDGKTPRIKNGSGDPMTIEDLVTEFKQRQEFGGGFKGSGASGSGAGGGKGGGDAGKVYISRADARDNTKYEAAKDRAKKEGKELVFSD